MVPKQPVDLIKLEVNLGMEEKRIINQLYVSLQKKGNISLLPNFPNFLSGWIYIVQAKCDCVGTWLLINPLKKESKLLDCFN